MAGHEQTDEMSPSTGLQPRQIRNSERVVEAAELVAATEGWAGLTLTATAVRAGLSRRAVHARYPNRPALGAAVWNERAGAVLGAALTDVLAAAGTLGDEASVPALAEALDRLWVGNTGLHAAAELLLAAGFDPVVRDAVSASLGARASAWCAGPDIDPTLAGCRGYLLVVGIGTLLVGRAPNQAVVDWASVARRLIDATRAGRRPAQLPSRSDTDQEYALEAVFDTGDVMLDSLLLATVRLVSELGYDQAGTAQIAVESGYSEGLLYSRYASKMELFLDASQRMAEVRVRANSARQDAIAAEFGAGIAEAFTMQEWQQPVLAAQRTLNTEQHRLAWHDATLRQANDDAFASMVDTYISRFGADGFAVFHFSLICAIGTVALPLLYPEARSLAYDVMTVPLAEHGLI